MDVLYIFSVTIKGAKNIKFYGGETITVLNPCHVSVHDFTH